MRNLAESLSVPIPFSDKLRSVGPALRRFHRLLRPASAWRAALESGRIPADAPILCYHAVEDSEASHDPFGLDVRPACFAQQMAWLARHRYRAVALDDVLPSPNPEYDGRLVAITFDDGYRSVAEHAAPLLEPYGYVATVFAVVERVGGTNRWEEESDVRARTFLSWDELRRLADAGWTVGSHTMTHRALTEISDHELKYELVESKRKIEEAMGREVRFLAYPYGRCDSRVAAAALAAGYDFGIALAPPKPGRMAVPRRSICRSTGMWSFRFEVRLPQG